jgi:hypothetical protein
MHSSTCYLKIIMSAALPFITALNKHPPPTQTPSKKAATPLPTKSAFQKQQDKFLRDLPNHPSYVQSDEDLARLNQAASTTASFKNNTYFANSDYDPSKPIITAKVVRQLPAFAKVTRDCSASFSAVTKDGHIEYCCALHGYQRSHDTATCFSILNSKSVSNRPYICPPSNSA